MTPAVEALRSEVAFRRQRVQRCRDGYARFPTRAADRALSSAENALELVLVQLENAEARHLASGVRESDEQTAGESGVEGVVLG